jgi:hypothetical protein
MKNKNHLKLICTLTLSITLLSVFWGNLSNRPLAQAAVNPNEEALFDITLPETIGWQGTIQEIRNDLDAEGNQYYVWSADLTDGCYGIRYQVYNKAGVPITQPTEVQSSCSEFSYYSPDISVNNNNFVITYVKTSVSVKRIEMTVYNRTTYQQIVAPQQVDTDQILSASSHPRVSTPPAGDQAGIVFAACEDSNCNQYNIFFQGYNNLFAEAHPINTLINSITAGNQKDPNISYSGNHYLITFTDVNAVQARAVNYTSDNLSPEINIDSLSSPGFVDEPDVGGTVDTDYTTVPVNESFYVTYVYHQIGGDQEIRMKKVYCQYDSGNPGNYSCNKTTREGEPVFVRVNSTDGSVTSPQIAVFKNTNDIKKQFPYENTNIDIVTVAWTILGADQYDLKAQNFTNTLTKSGNEIAVDEHILSTSPSISSNIDGHYAISYSKIGQGKHAKLYPSKYLKINSERVVNAPDTDVQENVKVAKNSNGDYVIAYQNFNGVDYDIVYALYNKYGNPIKNTTVANTTISGNQTNPMVKFWNEESSSGNYGKFIIVWEGNGSGDSNGIFYQIFDSEGNAIGSETLANNDVSYIQTTPDLSTGKYDQFAIVYHESPDKIMLLYKNDGNSIYNQLASASDNLSHPLVALSPAADGSIGTGGKSKFAVTWNYQLVDNLQAYRAEGYLSSSTTVNVGSAVSESMQQTADLEAGYDSALETLSPPLDAFYYARLLDISPALNIKSYGSGYTVNKSLDVDKNGSVSIDPYSQNIFVIGRKYADYSSYVNGEQVLLFPSDAPSTLLSGNHVVNSTQTHEADVQNLYSRYANIHNATAPFVSGETIGIMNGGSFESRGTNLYDSIEYVSGNFYRFYIDGTTNKPDWAKSGPTFSVNPGSYYGQSYSSVDAAYDSRSLDDTGKFIIAAYSNISSPDYIDANGVYQQMLEDPFSLGQREDLAPATEQQVNPGGKYLIVPETIDFGIVPRNTTGSVDFASLTPSCLKVTDLDGTDFDLTVSLTNLVNSSQPTEVISSSNFVIENNNGVNPDIITLLPFASLSDVTLDPSTNPGENANLGANKTLLKKNNVNTGAWEICPKVYLTIPGGVGSGSYEGTLTFTLI